MALQMLLRLLLKPAPDVRKKAKITLSDYQLVTAFFCFLKNCKLCNAHIFNKLTFCLFMRSGVDHAKCLFMRSGVDHAMCGHGSPKSGAEKKRIINLSRKIFL